MNEQELKEILEQHKLWLHGEPNGKRANLHGADLHGADLCGANLDFSQLNLSCKGLDFKIDEHLAKQLVYHVINLMQYSELNVNKVFEQHVYKWLEDCHIITQHKLPILKEKRK